MRDINWILLAKVPDHVMKGALIARLGEARIEVYAPERDAIVNLGSAPNLTLEGYSVLFDGYSIYVPKGNFQEALGILEIFEKDTWAPREGSARRPSDPATQFYFAALWTWLVPVLFHGIALYHFRNFLRSRTPFSWPKMLMAWLVWGLSLGVILLGLLNWSRSSF
ncbi:MAG: hypothetical protein ACK5Y2_03515 [Bdellovibrionales bacterium]